MSIPPYVRHSDTSRQAALSILPNAGSLQREVYECLLDAGTYGLTDAEIQSQLNMRGDTQRPRRVELCRKGLVFNSGRERKLDGTVRAARVWLAREMS